MEPHKFDSALLTILINQRSINNQFRRECGLSRAQIELLAYASTRLCFNAYDARQCFKQMNIQQLRLSIKKLIQVKALEQLNPGVRGRPSSYVISVSGRQWLRHLIALWTEVLGCQSVYEYNDFLHF